MLLVPPRRLGHPPRMSVVNPTRYEELDTDQKQVHLNAIVVPRPGYHLYFLYPVFLS